MSTHDMYFSKENKNHIFNIIKDLVLKETGIDINNNKEYIDLYRFKYPLIFERSISDNLVDINKELIDEIGPLLINDIINKDKNQISNKEVKEIKEIKEDKEDKEIKEIKDKMNTELHLNSTDNININNNRYDYYLSIPKQKLEFKIKEIIIPFENNTLFLNPIIFIDINKIKIKLAFTNSISMNDHQYNIYKPIDEIIIKNNQKFTRIEILNNLNMKILNETDKIMIQKIKEINIHNKNY